MDGEESYSEVHLESIRFYSLMGDYSEHFMPVNFYSYSLWGIMPWHNCYISLIVKSLKIIVYSLSLCSYRRQQLHKRNSTPYLL